MRFVLTSNTYWTVWNFRRYFIKGLLQRGHSVTVLSMSDESMDDRTKPLLEKLGAACVDIPLTRAGINPFQEMGLKKFYRRYYAENRPDVVMNYTVKPVLYSSEAAHACGVPRVYSMITGMGYVFTRAGVKQAMLRRLLVRLYRSALAKNRKVFFLNEDDRDFFVRQRLVLPGQVVRLHGEGVDTGHFEPRPVAGEGVSFLYMGRMLRDKGVNEFAAAARLLKAKYPAAEFRLLGGTDGNPTSIPLERILKWQAEGILSYHEPVADVRGHIAAASVFVLPSYREGLPISLIEAMSMGRAVISTRVPGCREVVREGDNGFLVEARDSEALAGAMERFLREPGLAVSMGEASRRIAVETYDVGRVNEVLFRELSA